MFRLIEGVFRHIEAMPRLTEYLFRHIEAMLCPFEDVLRHIEAVSDLRRVLQNVGRLF